MSFAMQMLQSHPGKPTGGDALARCIQACFDCAQTCTACADACLGENDPKQMLSCIRLNLDCADICEATGRVVTRQTMPVADVVRAALSACATACRHCGDECEMHGRHGMEHCRVCAESCRACEQACSDLMGQLAA
jgi:hypothetical protein